MRMKVMGRPSKYKPEYAEALPGMFENGESVAEVSKTLGISKVTFFAWLKKYEDFAAAYELGKQYSEAWWMSLGRDGAAGVQQINPTVWIFNMKNRFDWGDRSNITQDVVLKGDFTVSDEPSIEDFDETFAVGTPAGATDRPH